MSLFWEEHIKSDIDVFAFRERPYYGVRLFFYCIKIIRKCNFFKRWRIIKHAKELFVLEKEGFLDDYYKFLRRHDVYSHQASAANFYYFQFIKDKFVHKDELNFLEIGGGGGIFALLCLENLSIRNYVIIDLPEMLEIAKKNISQYHPEMIRHVTFLTPDQNPEITCDAFFNFNSFCEMEEKDIAEYFNLIYNIAKPGSIFFNVNYHRRIKNKDGGVSVNNPLLFPYRGKPILWETDRLYRSRKPFGASAYMRIEVIQS